MAKPIGFTDLRARCSYQSGFTDLRAWWTLADWASRYLQRHGRG